MSKTASTRSCADARQQFHAIDIQGRAMGAIGRRAVKAWRELAHASTLRCAAQGGQRKPAVAVGRRGVVAVIAYVRDAQVVIERGIARIDREELGAGVIGRARSLVALVA